MTYKEFKEKYNGKYVDTDNFPKEPGNKYQCFDLAQQYFTEALGLPANVLAGCGYVKNMLVKPKIDILLQYFDEVSRFDMRPGDVCIWSYEPGGHIALYDDYVNNVAYYFSQNYPERTNSHIQGISETNMRVFRIKKKQPQPIPNVERDENKNQIEVKVNDLNVRYDGTTNSDVVGIAKIGYYDYYETKEADGFVWYRIGMFQWIASKDEWTTVHPMKKKEIEVTITEKTKDSLTIKISNLNL